MIQVNKPIDIIIKAAGKQVVRTQYLRPLIYTQSIEVDDGLLIYNLLTREMVLLNNNELISYNSADYTNKLLTYLVENWFIVPNDFNDYILYKQTDSIFRMMSDYNKTPNMHTFVIYPTTDCNARCFYCFELTYKRINMTTKTAHDVAKYIINKCGGDNVQILWFGGEPLCNSEVIDVISNDLKTNGIGFRSKMTSNAFLFDEDLVTKAYNLWNLRNIQITLDGTEKIYNKTKNYIYKDISSPFSRVLSNIELLLKIGVSVDIRLNMDTYNCDDLIILSQQLCERFREYKKCKVYICILFEKTAWKYNARSIDEKKLLWKKYDEINKILDDNGLKFEFFIESYRKAKHCLADHNDCTTILPDGKLGKCEHYTDDNFYGSIYSNEIDEDIINKFKKVTNYGTQCQSCSLQPKCIPLEACPIREQYCDEFDKKMKIKYIKEQMKNSYKYFLLNKETRSCEIDYYK